MPTYDYHCAKCKKTYELRESFSAPDRHRCQECRGGTAKRVLTAPTVVFKGSGWYSTDSRSKTTAISDSSEKNGSSDSGDGKAEKTESKADAKGGDSKGETKSETKADAKPAKSEAKAAPAASSKD